MRMKRIALKIDCEKAKLHTVEIILDGKELVGVAIHAPWRSIYFGKTTEVEETVDYQVTRKE